MGARIVFRETAKETDGALLTVDFFLKAGGVIGEPHVHPRQEERFEVIQGTMCGRVAGREQTAQQGDVRVVPPGTHHAWWNGGDEEVHLFLEFRPALRTEEFFEVTWALARAGETDERGVPRSFWERMALIDDYRAEWYPPFAPRRLVTAIGALLGPIGRLLGHGGRPS